MEKTEFEDNADIGNTKMVKQEAVDISNTSLGEIKKEQSQDETPGEESTGRKTRKRKMNSMAETSDLSDESADENYSKSKSRKKSRGGGASAGRSRGRPKKVAASDPPANQADPSRNPRIVLKNIDSPTQDDAVSGNTKGNQDTPKATRGRNQRAAKTPAAKTPKSAPKGKVKPPKPPTDDEEEEEEEEIEEDDDNGDADFAEELDDDDDDEDFVPKKGKNSKAKSTPRARAKGKAKPKPKHDTEEEEDEDEADEDDEAAGIDAAGDGTDGNPNAVKTGQYLIEKTDMRRLENYPIWRMEGPNMLRKFEMIAQDGAVRHKSLYAYSSWAQSMLDLYEKIQVNHISSQDGETIVEISQECVPKAPELNSLEEKYSGDQLLTDYNILAEAMFRQAVDSGFLKQIKQDNDQHYINAINHIDNIIREKISNIESEVSMKDEFKTRVRNCPNMKTIRRQNWSQTDQATTNKSTEKGVRSVLMFGYGYDLFLMEEDKSKGVEVAQEVVVGSTMDQYLVAYHGLIHFKYNLLKRCQDKVKLMNALELGGDANILERCLRDRAWILQTFEDLKNLLSNENLS